MVFGQNAVDLSTLEFESGNWTKTIGNLEITLGSMIINNRFETSNPDSSKFVKFVWDNGKREMFYFSPGNGSGLLIYDEELEISFYCGVYDIIVKGNSNNKLLYRKSKPRGGKTYTFANCGFKALEYNYTEKKLYYCQTGIFNNSKRKVLKLMELTRNN